MKPAIAWLAASLWSIGCAGDEPVGDSGGPAEPGYVWGDPILQVGSSYASETPDQHWELLDATWLGDDRALAVGQGGAVVVSALDGAVLARDHQDDHLHRGYDAAWDETTGSAWVNTRLEGLIRYALGGDAPLLQERLKVSELATEDIAAGGGLVLVAARSDGALLLDGDGGGAILATIPAASALAVALDGDRAAVADGAELSLWDVSDPSAPAELDRLTLPGDAYDLAMDGDHLAAAMGGEGVAAIGISAEGALSQRAILDPGGASYGAALDGDALWMAAWDEVALADLAADPPVVLGTEPASLSMGVAAGGGHAVAASWGRALTMERVPGAAGPEISTPRETFVPEGTWEPVPVTFANLGAMALNVTFDEGAGLEPLALEPGSSEAVWLDPLAPWTSWSSDDPDEPAGESYVFATPGVLGATHAELELPAFTWPDPTLTTWRLSDHAGGVVFLAWFEFG